MSKLFFPTRSHGKPSIAPGVRKRWCAVLSGGALLLLLPGCVSGALFFVSGNNRAETIFEEDSVDPEQVILQQDFPGGLAASQIFAMVEKVPDGTPQGEMQCFFEKNADEPESFRAHSLLVVKIPGADRQQLISGPATICCMAAGCSAGILEVFDPILLPYAVYTHIKCYGGERYFSIFRDAAGKPLLLFNFDVTTGRQAAVPAHISADYWECVKTMWVRSERRNDELPYSSMLLMWKKRETDAPETPPDD